MINVTSSFKDYLINIHKIETEKSAQDYIRTMPKVKQWFVQNRLIDSDYNLWDINIDLVPIQNALITTHKDNWKKAAQKGEYGDSGFMMATWNRWVEFSEWQRNKTLNPLKYEDSILSSFKSDYEQSGLINMSSLISKFLSSIICKPFVILTGLSGSGKTKIAQAFATWISGSKEQYSIVPVGADWTNREPLLGYPNSLDNKHYVLPDSGVLKILLSAFNNYRDNGENVSKCKPYFLILDEMNLSHVERYFADFLSAMESGEYIKLYSDGKRSWKTDSNGNYDPQFHVEHQIKLPPNLFIIGTVNIDETTYMFSPKVLDRANTIEFRISESEMNTFILNKQQLDMNKLLDDPISGKGKGSTIANDFMNLLSGHGLSFEKSKHKEMFEACFTPLQMAGAEFGYRVVNEITRLISYLEYFGVENNEAYDIAIMQKLLPKLNGSRSKLSKVLLKLGQLCLTSNKEQDAIDIFNQFRESRDFKFDKKEGIKYPISLEKLCRMYKNAQENGFASFAEA